VEDVGVQKLEDHHAHLLVASAAQLSYRAKPCLIVQFLSSDSLDHVQKLLRDEAFEFPEGLLLENRPYLLLLFRCALAEHQLANFMKQRRRRIRESSLQLFPSLQLCQPCQLAAGEPEKSAHLVVDIRPIRRRGQLFARQQLRDIGLGDLGGRGQVLLLETELLESLLDDETHVHRLLPSNRLQLINLHHSKYRLTCQVN
jgi:hypothetical protein